VRQRLRPLITKESSQDLVVLKELIEADQVTPVIDKTYPLSQVPNAIRATAGRTRPGEGLHHRTA